MPELIRAFGRGRMNKDLDERIIPNGEYRDALNLEISASEDSDVGAFENIKGNIELKNRSYNSNTGVYQTWDSAKNSYISDLSNPVCIGSTRNTKTEKVYWFIASDDTSIIAEYDQTTKLITPILVDKNNILKFSKDYLITGINIVEDFLFWTDDQTEPKKINITKFKIGSTDFNTHTKIPRWSEDSQLYSTNLSNRPDFEEQHVTVIKKSPLNAPTINSSASGFGNNPDGTGIDGTGITPVISIANSPAGTGTFNFTYLPDAEDPTEYESLPTYGEYQANLADDPEYYIDSNISNGWDGNVVFTVAPPPGTDPDTGLSVWQIGDIIKLSGTYEDNNETFEYSVSIKITVIVGTAVYGQIQAISSDILRITDPDADYELIEWETLLVENKPMFEYVFPRFAYRWKYKDNEYSCFSAFSKVAFIGNEFKYVSSDGYNIGMTNNVRKLSIESLDWGDEEVEEIEILYKESNNNTVYSVDSLKRYDYVGSTLPTTFEITSEIIGRVIESNQLLRPWDNVPRKAKSQELIGNRVVYGNYLQNYKVKPISLDVGLESDDHPSITYQGQEEENPFLRMPSDSLKSIRTYQVGVVFKDQYGRETPVFTDKTASVKVDIENSDKLNKLSISPAGDAPDWATHYKFFVKETSNQYYNLALDRYYEAEDGNIWLSFPSSERNKVDEQTYLISKKQHDNDVAIDELSRYKILAIENEAPEFIATFKRAIAQSDVEILTGFEQDYTLLTFNGPSETANSAFALGFVSGNYLRITNGGAVTDDYLIESGGRTGQGNQYSVRIATPLGLDAAFLNDLTGSVTIIITNPSVERLPEFEGRFFVKINRDYAFDTNIIASFANLNKNYGVLGEMEISHKRIGNKKPPGGWAWLDNGTTCAGCCSNGRKNGSLGNGNGNFGIHRDDFDPPIKGQDYFGFLQGWKTSNDQFPNIDGVMAKVGAQVRFIGPNGEQSEVYTVEQYEKGNGRRGRLDGSSSFFFPSCDDWGDQREIPSNKRVEYWFKLDREIKDDFLERNNWLPLLGWNDGVTNSPCIKVQVVQELVSDGNKLLTSTNPAIFETEPKEAVDLDIYNEATGALPISQFNNVSQIIDYSNCYSYGNGVESNRIRDDYNAVIIDKGPKVSAPLDEPYTEERRGSGMIYSQIFNSMSGVNRLNQFIQAEQITKDLNPTYGTIQKLHARDTDLICLTEDKCFNILANKDALYNADGSANVTSNFNVLGQDTPYVGEFGISKNPESFASYGFRSYFTDKARGTVIRLSRDGIEEIAVKGMGDFFSDNLPYSKTLIGSFDDVNNAYNLTLDGLSTEWQEKLQTGVFDRTNCDVADDTSDNITSTTLTFKEANDGWESRKSFIKESGLSLNGEYYTFKRGLIWQHRANNIHNNFYKQQYDSSLDFIFNEAPESVKVFKTLNYAGTKARDYKYNVGGGSKKYNLAEIQASNLVPTNEIVEQGWYTNWIRTDLQEGALKTFLDKEGKYFNYIKGLDTYFTDNCDNNVDSNEFSVQGIGRAVVSGDVDQSEFNVHLYVDNSCFIQPFNVHLYVDDVCFTEPDPDDPTDPVESFLIDLDFVGQASNATQAYTWTNPSDPTEIVDISAKGNTNHGCNRGTYKIVANRHVNGGVTVGRFYVGNVRGVNYYDSYTLNANNDPSSPTGDVENVNGISAIPSAQDQYNNNQVLGLDSLGNASTRIYPTGSTEFGTDQTNSRQRYIVAGPNQFDYGRITYVNIQNDDASNIAQNFTDPNNADYVTFTLVPDTYRVDGSFDTHGDSIWFQVFRKRDTSDPNSQTEEIFAGLLGTNCQYGQTCDPNQWPTVTFDVSDGSYVENYIP
jgi:hypothetical protein